MKEKRPLPETLIQKEKGKVKESSPDCPRACRQRGPPQGRPIHSRSDAHRQAEASEEGVNPLGGKEKLYPSGAQGTAASPPAVAGERSPPAEPLDGGAPTLGCTHASARGPAEGTVITGFASVRVAGQRERGKELRRRAVVVVSVVVAGRRRRAGTLTLKVTVGDERTTGGREQRDGWKWI